jgi:hypothetical protein
MNSEKLVLSYTIWWIYSMKHRHEIIHSNTSKSDHRFLRSEIFINLVVGRIGLLMCKRHLSDSNNGDCIQLLFLILQWFTWARPTCKTSFRISHQNTDLSCNSSNWSFQKRFKLSTAQFTRRGITLSLHAVKRWKYYILYILSITARWVNQTSHSRCGNYLNIHSSMHALRRVGLIKCIEIRFIQSHSA